MSGIEAPPVVVLVGMMGTGKSTVARLLGDEMGRMSVDTDATVEHRSGMTVRQIFETAGEQKFREMESAVLETALQADVPCVVAAAGGIVVSDSNREMLNHARRSGAAVVVWLSAGVEELVRRTQRGDHRPLLDAGAEAGLRAMAESREALYKSVADHRVDTDGLVPKDVCARIIAYLSRRADTGAGEGSGSNE